MFKYADFTKYIDFENWLPLSYFFQAKKENTHRFLAIIFRQRHHILE